MPGNLNERVDDTKGDVVRLWRLSFNLQRIAIRLFALPASTSLRVVIHLPHSCRQDDDRLAPDEDACRSQGLNPIVPGRRDGSFPQPTPYH